MLSGSAPSNEFSESLTHTKPILKRKSSGESRTSVSRKKNGIQALPKVLENPVDKRRLAELEAQILANLGNGQFFIVAMALREIDEQKFYVPEKNIYAFAKNKFAFSRRTTNTYLCSASVYESILEDETLPTPGNISHIRSLHKFPPDARRFIWKHVCESGQPVTEESVVNMTIKYETGVAFSDLSNEFYTPPDIIAAAKKVIGKLQFDLDPASCNFANELHVNNIAKNIMDERMNGLSLPWAGDVWLSPPSGTDKSGNSRQSIWFLTAEAKYLSGEISSCHLLLRIDYGTEWFLQALNYPYCHFNTKITFTTPTGREKARLEDYIVIYMGRNTDAFCTNFSSFGVIPGFNSWSYRPYSGIGFASAGTGPFPELVLDSEGRGPSLSHPSHHIPNNRLSSHPLHMGIHGVPILPNSKEILGRCFRENSNINSQLMMNHSLADGELLRCDQSNDHTMF